MQSHINISFTITAGEQRDILLALLANAGYSGFEEKENELEAYISSDEYDEASLKEITGPLGIGFSIRKIEAVNWNAVWESNFQPVVVEDFAAIRADFHEPITHTQYEIVITPKMSFGTGHHATTFMMMRQMRSMDFSGKQVFDFGTGTGILAILAEKLGAAHIDATDNDEWSIANTAENLERNDCIKVKLEKKDDIPAGEPYDIILANINKNVIVHFFSDLVRQLKPGGILLLSGLLEEDASTINELAATHHLKTGEKMLQNNWISLRFSR